MPSVTFQVRAQLEDKEDAVHIVGDADVLGHWLAQDAVPMSLANASEGLWSVELNIPAGTTVNYAYIIRRGWSLRRREGFMPRRQLVVSGDAMTVDDLDFGVCGTGDNQKERVEPGLLCGDLQLRVTLGRHDLDGVATPGVLLYDNAASFAASFRTVSKNAFGLNSDLWSNFNHRDVDTFVVSAPSREDLSFFIEVEVPAQATDVAASEGSASKPVRARVYVQHRELECKGELRRPILDAATFEEIGEVTLQYLVITPLRHPLNTLQREWSAFHIERAPLVVGHRGAGATNSPKVLHTLTENTLISFLGACRDGADYVEFDVQLTKDGVPIIVHDEEIILKTVGSDGQELRQRVAVNKLVFDKFRQLRPVMPLKDHERQMQESDATLQRSGDKPLHEQPLAESIRAHVSPRIRSKSAILRRMSVGDNWQTRLENYPALAELFEFLPHELGFNVEIKYPFSAKYETFLGIMERNAYVDRILSVMLEKAGSRKVYISSFDPDVCVMCVMKQSRFPVFLLTTGGRVFFRNPVKNSLEAAINFARREKLCGVVSEASAVLADVALVQQARQDGLHVFTYGGLNKDPVTVRQQLECGVDGIITDTVSAIEPATRPNDAHRNRLESDSATGAFSISPRRPTLPKAQTEDDLLHLITTEQIKH
eukprot:TRINITY_DN27564_c0_g1_i1.p1 TRINITY_DN27564_c0_g1~~TRINITY_DN27564_c0_g1_i1.p1  ORF type:complete len:656 (+),score=235.23 TRINITY_DN27564_c0_g1_i1:173-2140(+)